MIDLHERLSEYSYGFGVTREVQSLLEGIGLKPTPFLPNLLHEKELGFDVGFSDLGSVVVLQFKLGHQLKRFHRAHSAQTIPQLDRPFWRFSIDTLGHQFQRLREFEDENADTFYVAPRFADWGSYDRVFQAGQVLEASLLLRPSDIESAVATQGGSAGPHRIVYDRTRRYVCSEPTELPEYRPNDLASKIRYRIQHSDMTLENSIERIFDREPSSRRISRLSLRRRDQILSRFKDHRTGMAAAVGAEAWTQGAQVLFVSLNEEASVAD